MSLFSGKGFGEIMVLDFPVHLYRINPHFGLFDFKYFTYFSNSLAKIAQNSPILSHGLTQGVYLCEIEPPVFGVNFRLPRASADNNLGFPRFSPKLAFRRFFKNSCHSHLKNLLHVISPSATVTLAQQVLNIA